MPRPRIHLIGLFHTIPNNRYSHCAFTGKVLRFSKMLRMYGWEVVEYSNGESESEASEHVRILTEDEVLGFSSRKSGQDFYGNDAVMGNPMHVAFEGRLLSAIQAHATPGDIICHPFGQAHAGSVPVVTPTCYHVESGIGYPNTWANFRVFESSAWFHWMHGTAKNSMGTNYNWVVPNYFDLTEWTPKTSPNPGGPVVFMGRITGQKGMATVMEIAKRMPEQKFLLAGQGDPDPWFKDLPNVEHVGSLHGNDRSKFVEQAMCMIMPTDFLEPFGGSGVEAQLVGTPVITTDFGAFRETVVDGVSGYRCHTLGDYLRAIQLAPELDRSLIAQRARGLYSLEACGKLYSQIFDDIADQSVKGWYSEHSNRF